jgi:hypothetical protein
MKNTTFLKKLLFSLVVLLFISCDRDYNTIGSDIIGNENFSTDVVLVDVTAFNQKIGPVQTNNLPVNKLGVYSDNVFGKTEANFVTQLSLATVKPTFTSNVVIDSVILTVPYFSKIITPDADGRIYALDSIYPKAKPYPSINLQVYENGYYLNDFDPLDNLKNQKYYSNQYADIDPLKKGDKLNNSAEKTENIDFVPSNKEYVKYKVDPTTLLVPDVNREVESKSSPRMRLHLNKDMGVFKKIIDDAKNTATAVNFETNNNFKFYNRGLYFKTESAASGTMMSLDFTKGDVTIYYKQDKVKQDENLPIPSVDKREMKSLVLSMSGNTVNLLNTTPTTDYLNALNTADATAGDATLYAKGGQGSTVFIDLPTAQLAQYKNNNWLINNASLTFNIDKSKMGTIAEPQRIYLYNVDNNRPIIDYYFDTSTNTINSKLNKAVHGGIIEKESDGRGTKYKIRLTEHINNIINKDSTNVRLGVVVTENIIDARSAFLKTTVNFTTPSVKKFDRVPVASVINPLGTIFYGTNASVADDKKVKLEIRYTKPN